SPLIAPQSQSDREAAGGTIARVNRRMAGHKHAPTYLTNRHGCASLRFQDESFVNVLLRKTVSYGSLVRTVLLTNAPRPSLAKILPVSPILVILPSMTSASKSNATDSKCTEPLPNLHVPLGGSATTVTTSPWLTPTRGALDAASTGHTRSTSAKSSTIS